jgi:hypothetical protein
VVHANANRKSWLLGTTMLMPNNWNSSYFLKILFPALEQKNKPNVNALDLKGPEGQNPS